MAGLLKGEKGLAVVEATLLLPFCFLMIFALYYAAIFLCQKANLQANLENALVYYKNMDSDTYVTAQSRMLYASGGETVITTGDGYQQPTYQFPYRFLGVKFKSGQFEQFFRSMCGYMFFDDGSNVQLTTKVTNYVVYKEITATAKQTVKPAISFKLLGLPDTVEISCTSSVVITNGDDFIRNIDFAVDIVEDTKIGQAAGQFVDKVKNFYDKFKEKFGVN